MPKGKYKRTPRPAIFPVGPSIAYIQLPRGLFSCVDWDDAIWMQEMRWWARTSRKTEVYARRNEGLMHSFILPPVPGKTVDHVNCTRTLDNRRANLRYATASEQACNRRKFSNNKSGYRGVYLHGCGRYAAAISVEGKQKHIGLFATAEGAHKAYSEVALRLHGDFARSTD
jgi:hypothetical protein